MRVSCLMPTYRRFPQNSHLVSEAVESFLRQDYDDKELIICNDEPEQSLSLRPSRAAENASIVILNTPRFGSLGEKTQYMASHSSGDVLCRWDDDDIHLPHRISYSVARLTKLAWVPNNYLFYDRESIRYINGGTISMGVWRRELISKIPHTSDTDDRDFLHEIERLGQDDRSYVPYEDCFYIYRWNTGSFHISGCGTNGWNRAAEQPFEPGDFAINPYWARDYRDFTDRQGE